MIVFVSKGYDERTWEHRRVFGSIYFCDRKRIGSSWECIAIALRCINPYPNINTRSLNIMVNTKITPKFTWGIIFNSVS